MHPAHSRMYLHLIYPRFPQSLRSYCVIYPPSDAPCQEGDGLQGSSFTVVVPSVPIFTLPTHQYLPDLMRLVFAVGVSFMFSHSLAKE